jgi:outer membrane protein TolC
VIRIIFFLLFSTALCGQSTDSTKVFSLEQYLHWVRSYHPMMLQAALLQDQAEAQLLEAKSIFDPKWYGDYEDKSFDQKNYFKIGEAGLKIPTWFGTDIKMAYLWSNGDFLNSQNKLPENGQAIIGLEVPLLQGLFFDQRRAQVRQAALWADANEASRRTMINDLMISAIEAYWNWAYQYQEVIVYESALALANNRFTLTRESYAQGDKPAIDTLEALIQIQNRELELNLAQVELQNAALELANFLWYEDLVPLEPADDIRPENLLSLWQLPEDESTKDLLQSLPESHPELISISIKQKQLNIKERLKREAFKPQLMFNYNFLGDGFDWTSDQTGEPILNNLLTENYKWGLTFRYPLLLRKERAGLQFVQLEQLDTQYKLKNKTLQLSNKIVALVQQIKITSEQLQTLDAMVQNYEALLDAENEKFRIGESSIFLLNNREQKLVEAQLKLQKMQATFQKLRWKLVWAKGELR